MSVWKRAAVGVLALAVTAAVPAMQAAAQPGPASESSDARVANLAQTPPMGWNTWNTFGCDINEDLIKQAADAMVSSGMKDAGYEYVVVDDCWMALVRDLDGNLMAHPDRFPSGMRALADYVHGKGLKFGIYSVPTEKTCAQRNSMYPGETGSLGHERQDAAQFAAWGVDYLKYDWCSPDGDLEDQKRQFTLMRDALRDTGRPIVYSINPNSFHYPKTGATYDWSAIAHMWRTTEDITTQWDTGNSNDYPMGIVNIIDVNGGLADQAGPGHWNDPDMLEVGVGGLTPDENQAHLSMWALMAAPLIAGNDIRTMTPATREMLTNTEVLAVDQDALGVQGRKVRDDGDFEVWQKPLSDGSVAVVLLNRSSSAASISTTAREVGLPAADSYIARDLWTHTESETAGTITAQLPPHAAAMYRVRVATHQDKKAAPFLAVELATPKYLKGGEPVELTAAFTNLGSRTAPKPALALRAPEGWAVDPVSGTTVHRIAAGRTHTAQWRVTPPADASGLATLAGTITVKSPDGPITTTGFATVYAVQQPSGTQYASDLPWLSETNGWGPAERDTSNGENVAGDGRTITLNGVTYAKGIGAHAYSNLLIYLGGTCRTFTAVVGVDDEVGSKGSVTFEVWADGRRVADSGVLRGDDPGMPLSADLSGTTELELRVTDAGDGNGHDHADWADAQISCQG